MDALAEYKLIRQQRHMLSMITEGLDQKAKDLEAEMIKALAPEPSGRKFGCDSGCEWKTNQMFGHHPWCKSGCHHDKLEHCSKCRDTVATAWGSRPDPVQGPEWGITY